ncbi:MAG TPA: HAMP domain-containing sensor histidine kinase [Candidatus Macondimonas sp.]|nr:HAMP domain-containing sensor histidine kinase [Candidatus Macondimonas sp.]
MRRRFFYQPRSILRLILISYVVVLIPPILAIFIAIGSLELLFAQGRTAVLDSVRAAQNGRALIEQVAVMERGALQFLAVGDPVFMQSYRRTREALLASADALAPLTRSPEFASRLAAFQAHEIEVAARLQSPEASAADIAAIAHEFDVLQDAAQDILDQSSAVINDELLSIQRSSERARWTIIGIAAIQLPLAILAAIVFTLLIGHPLRALRRAIEGLGDGLFTRPIRLRGPRDISMVGQRLDWLRQRLIDLEEQKAQFLRQVSHELKTPLSAIREGAQLLSDDVAGPLNPAQQEILEILSRNAIQLQQLIEDMLNFNMSQSHRPALNPRRVDLALLITSLLQDHKPALLSKALALETRIEAVSVVADEGKLRTILDNMLSNAAKFSPRTGRLFVSCGLHANEVWVDVRDEGPGIPMEERERIFEAFFQGKAAIPGGSVVKGSGIGLAIAREFARAHGGDIEVLPAERGAWVRLRLPGGTRA